MLSFEEAGKILDEAVDALPEGIYDDLNGGVNLIPGERTDADGNYIMGLYHHDEMGRWVEIFYGSFAALYADAPDDAVAEKLKKTLRHELTHHVENKAGDRTLERWDEEQKLLWEQEAAKPLEADSILFADEDGTLSEEADRLFREALPEFPKSGWTRLGDATAALLGGCDAVLCMTLDQADALAERFPEHDEKIMCLGQKDILPGRRAGRQLRREIAYLAEELRAEEER